MSHLAHISAHCVQWNEALPVGSVMLREALKFIHDSSPGVWAQPIRAQSPFGVVIHASYAKSVRHLVTHLTTRTV